MRPWLACARLAAYLLVIATDPAGSQPALLQAQGKVTFLRAHDVGSAFGPPADQIDVEVVFRLDSDPTRAFGFQIRDNLHQGAHQAMLALLRDAFNHGWTVTTDFRVEDQATSRNGVAIRVALRGNDKRIAYQYLAKFVCGRPGESGVLPTGVYFSAINVHNPGSESVVLRERISVALPDQEAGPVSEQIEARLDAGHSLEIDCPEILRRLRDARFAKGFVTIEAREALEVVGVYAAARESDGEVVTEDIERVPPRMVQLRFPDLLPLPDASGSFCRRSGNNLLVTVANRGAADASETRTEVDFLQGTRRLIMTPPLARDASTTVSAQIPPGVFAGDGTHTFLITADKEMQEEEESEANNFAIGQCVIID